MTPEFYIKVLGIFHETMEDLQNIISEYSTKQKNLGTSEHSPNLQPLSISQSQSESDSSEKQQSSKSKTKKIKKKKKQIPGMPKPPPNSFVLYLQQIKHEIQKQNPGISIAAVTSIASKQWKQIPESQKKHYKDLHETNRKEYIKKKQNFLKQYNQNNSNNIIEQNTKEKPKKKHEKLSRKKSHTQKKSKKATKNGEDAAIIDLVDVSSESE